ncbi:hypothetical protein V493_00074 [Pseudogymnoascus sp. VKM F-4281 (FW-2241)]|nr:hypothetical protein V493_00074 [Pseudogymnoascus sp. VKM F-4281 (FW-2241)]
MPHNRQDEADRYIEAAQKSMAHVAFAVLISPSPCLDGSRLDEDYFCKRGAKEAKAFNLEQILTVLTMMDRGILLAIIDGTLPRRSLTDLQQAVRQERNIPDAIPGIYVNYVADKNGIHPTKKDITSIVEAMEKYIDEFEDVKVFSRVIDYIFKPRDPAQVLLSGEPDGPIRGGISEVGFSINITSRLLNHKKHQESQGVMTLFDACGQHLFPDRYAIQGFPVVRVVNPLVVDMAESLISRLASSYVTWGWGFNANQAGASVQGVNSLSILQASTDQNGKDSWATIEAEASTTGIEEELSLVKDYTAVCRDEMADIIHPHTTLLDADYVAQQRYHAQFKRLRGLASDEADAA